MKLGIRDLKAKSGRDSGLKVYARGGMPKITLGITGLHEFWVGITGLKNPIGDPLRLPPDILRPSMFESGLDCKTVRIFAYSSKLKRSNENTPYGRVRLARFARVILLRHALLIFLLILRKKATVLQSKSGSEQILYKYSELG